jgi:hypothetical protein
VGIVQALPPLIEFIKNQKQIKNIKKKQMTRTKAGDHGRLMISISLTTKSIG